MVRARRATVVALGAALLAACAAERANSQTPDAAAPARLAAQGRPTAPDGYVSVQVVTVIPGGDGSYTVILVEPERQWALPISIGEAEARAIMLRLEGKRFPRPLTHDLLDTVVDRLGGVVEKVHVDDLRSGTFFGTIFVRQGERLVELDARPSDALALAVGRRIPIFVARRALSAGGFPVTDLDKDADPDTEHTPSVKPGDTPTWLPPPVGDPI